MMAGFNIKQAIKDEIERKASKAERDSAKATPGTVRSVLDGLLDQIQKVDFYNKSDIPEDKKIPRKIYVVLVIDVLLETAGKNNWGLATRNGFIYAYNGKYWQPMDAEDFKPFLAEAAIKMGVPILEGKYHMFKDELYKQFLSESTLRPPVRSNRTLINVQNGTFEITRNWQGLREFNRKDFLKYQLSFEYNPKSKCPIFDK